MPVLIGFFNTYIDSYMFMHLRGLYNNRYTGSRFYRPACQPDRASFVGSSHKV